MKTTLRDLTRSADDHWTSTLREYADRRLSFALRPFASRVEHVTVRVSDVNGPRRGVDSRCLVEVDLAGGHTVRAEATTPWPFASITRAAARLAQLIRRDLGKTREAPRRAARRVRSRQRALA